jgi:G:T-mismatch repair DNA endonuclease (very short patch repair protein)
LEKIEGNKSRDEMAFKELRQLGWKKIEIWECDIKKSI